MSFNNIKKYLEQKGEPQYVIKDIIRKSNIIKFIWCNSYKKEIKRSDFSSQIKKINLLDLLERKNLTELLLNRNIKIKNSKITNFYYKDFSSENCKLLYKESFRKNFIKKGAWDKNKMELIPNFYEKFDSVGPIAFKSMIQLFENDLPYNKTKEFKHKFNNENLNANICEKQYHKLYNKMKEEGYKSQKEMGNYIKGSKMLDEIRIAIDRNGKPGFIASGGNHRLAIAKILNIEKLPVIVDGVHSKWAKKCVEKYNKNDVLKAINQGLQNLGSK
ncbi:hypothetical protein [Halarsenatibacter silvermanii]|uniref:ParB-like nuclease domain-containing protein n=1 Tax=Halarsenatibacter silvermanii TaxID=321763 RepID=A0A1G9HYV8_9FIRM|nr:hypothetical protein [Halarsenatibacter silvermanii]SDL18170.1 hypothetical protein SAMN04488692_10270 [Halarsenatibacter silvermanii]